MKIQHKETKGGGKFFIMKNDEEIAEMTYRKRNDSIIAINHTGVDEDYREQGLGGELVKAAVEYAREHHIKIIPICPFVKEEFDENQSYKDVLK